MFGNTGHHHPRTKKERETMMRIEARSHALECERLASARRILQGNNDPTAEALERAAKFLRHLTGDHLTQPCELGRFKRRMDLETGNGRLKGECLGCGFIGVLTRGGKLRLHAPRRG